MVRVGELWSLGDSNPWPLACHASALPAELRPQLVVISYPISALFSRRGLLREIVQVVSDYVLKNHVCVFYATIMILSKEEGMVG